MLFKMEYGNENYLQIHMPGRFRSTCHLCPMMENLSFNNNYIIW